MTLILEIALAIFKAELISEIRTTTRVQWASRRILGEKEKVARYSNTNTVE
jgi:hypothetical protein